MFYTFIIKSSLNPWFFLISKSLPVVEGRGKSYLGLGALFVVTINWVKTRSLQEFFPLTSLS